MYSKLHAKAREYSLYYIFCRVASNLRQMFYNLRNPSRLKLNVDRELPSAADICYHIRQKYGEDL